MQMRFRSLSDFVDSLQARGRYTFARDEAREALGGSDLALKRAIERLSKKRRIVMVGKKFYVIVPLEYQVSGILPATWFIEDFMTFVGRPYYVGLLSAAALHGAAHQQPQEFHVITKQPKRDIEAAGLKIRFFMKLRMEQTPFVRVKTETGYIRVSSPGATAIDLVRYEARIGGIHRTVTVLQELAESIKGKELLEAAKLERKLAYVQRLGYLLEKIGRGDIVSPLARWITSRQPNVTILNPRLARKGFPRDRRWNIIKNIEVEGEL